MEASAWTAGASGVGAPIASPLRALLSRRMRAMTGGGPASLEAFAHPAGDPGLLGPDSVAWRVHADFTAMLCGGLSSLMVQALHTRALAAVWDHSDFRRDLRGRLARTAYFVAVTTYGGRALALDAIARVNRIHARISGIDLQGKPYVANEPALIAWVHLVEVRSFLAAYQHLSRRPLSAVEQDRYIAEMADIGQRLGASDLPLSWAENEAQLLSHRQAWRLDARAREILRCIQAYPSEPPDRPFVALVQAVALDLLPAWARDLMGRPAPCPLAVQARRRALQLASAPLQGLLAQQGVAATARARVQAQGWAQVRGAPQNPQARR